MDWQSIGLLVGGFFLLIAGGELLVRAAVRLAVLARISPLVIGLTVVSFGTSAPELAVSIQAGMQGAAGLAVANVVGSNIFNILFTVGLCALVARLVVNQQLVRLDVPLLVAVSIFTYVLALDGAISPLEGIVLLLGIIAYTSWGIRQSRHETSAIQEEYAQEYGDQNGDRTRLPLYLAVFVGGLATLVIGAGWLVEGATALARALGVGETIIGLTIVAAGTSLPEVATSLVATFRGERDIAIGNVVGSNLFNLLAILGAAALVTPGGLPVDPGLIRADMLLMIAVAVAIGPIFLKGSIDRWEAGLFLIAYALYMTFLVLQGNTGAGANHFGEILLTYVLPMVTFLILWAGWLAIRAFNRLPKGDVPE